MGMKKQMGPEVQDFNFAAPRNANIVNKDTRGFVLFEDDDTNEGYDGTVIVLGTGPISKALANRIRHLLALSDACLEKLEEGEPFFTLRGKDALTPALIVDWMLRAGVNGVDAAKFAEAARCALACLKYPSKMPT